MKRQQVLELFQQDAKFHQELSERLSGVFKCLDKVLVASRAPLCQEESTLDPSRCIFIQFNKSAQYNRNKQPYFKKTEVTGNPAQPASTTFVPPAKTGYKPNPKINYSVFYNNDLLM